MGHRIYYVVALICTFSAIAPAWSGDSGAAPAILGTSPFLDQLNNPNYKLPPPGPTIESNQPVLDPCGMNYDCPGERTNPAEDLPLPEDLPKTPEPVPDAD